MVEDTFGEHRVKLPAGDLVLYPGTSVHRVEPVTRGHRVASYFWIRSMVRSEVFFNPKTFEQVGKVKQPS